MHLVYCPMDNMVTNALMEGAPFTQGEALHRMSWTACKVRGSVEHSAFVHARACLCMHVPYLACALSLVCFQYITFSIAFFTLLHSYTHLVARLPPVVKYHIFILPYLSFVPAA
jgi:hypothetical protein